MTNRWCWRCCGASRRARQGRGGGERPRRGAGDRRPAGDRRRARRQEPPRRVGLDLSRQLKAVQPELEVILITGYASLETAVEAVQIGAFDYLTKPIEDYNALSLKVQSAIEKSRCAAASARWSSGSKKPRSATAPWSRRRPTPSSCTSRWDGSAKRTPPP